MVAAAKVKRAQENAERSRPYANKNERHCFFTSPKQ